MPKTFKDLTQEDKDYLLEQWLRTDISKKEISNEISTEYGVVDRTVRKWIQKLGITQYVQEQSRKTKLVQNKYDVVSEDKKKIYILENDIKALKSQLKIAQEHVHSSDDIRELVLGVRDFEYKQKTLPDLNSLSDKVNGVPVLMLSDTHYGEVVNPAEVGYVNSYNSEIAERRINFTVDSAIKIIKKDWTAYNTEWFVLTMIGDMLSGSIHDELAENNDERILPSIMKLSEILIYQIEKIKDNFNKVYVPCIVGNHGRMHRKPRAKGMVEENFEYIVYKLIEKHFLNDENVIIQVSETPDLRFDIFNKRFLLTHGNTLGGGGNGIAGVMPLLFRGNYKKQERANSIGNNYDTLLIGHYHQSLFLGDKVYVNGTTKGIDEYALNMLNISFEKPSQNLFIVDRKYNEVTYRLPIFCEPEEDLEIEHTVRIFE